MSQTITAVYEDGVLRPLLPLSLPNKTRVRVQIEPSSDSDPVLELIGVFNSDKPLIDNIPVSEDPDLYLVAEALGAEAEGLHAWEIAPTRYQRGADGKPIRLD
jgi:predicted DNA-binding antitoxin AbrB/MazE fold protein